MKIIKVYITAYAKAILSFEWTVLSAINHSSAHKHHSRTLQGLHHPLQCLFLEISSGALYLRSPCEASAQSFCNKSLETYGGATDCTHYDMGPNTHTYHWKISVALSNWRRHSLHLFARTKIQWRKIQRKVFCRCS